MRQLTTTIEIKSSPDVVWAILTDFAAYPEWNPFIREVTGHPSEGARLSVRLQNPGGKAMTFVPTVTEAIPERRFSWLGKLGLKGVFDGHHHFDIAVTEGSTVQFTQSEEFSGALVPVLWGMVANKTRAGFESMNTALKERAEGR
ncbi:MAG: SRPBCC domain-containing protein [Acidimicrobiia bacterium]